VTSRRRAEPLPRWRGRQPVGRRDRQQAFRGADGRGRLCPTSLVTSPGGAIDTSRGTDPVLSPVTPPIEHGSTDPRSRPAGCPSSAFVHSRHVGLICDAVLKVRRGVACPLSRRRLPHCSLDIACPTWTIGSGSDAETSMPQVPAALAGGPPDPTQQDMRWHP
jgi:hypothetical protein